MSLPSSAFTPRNSTRRSRASSSRSSVRCGSSIAESIDWARALVLLGAEEIDAQTFKDTMSVIVKHRTDLDTVAARVGVKLEPSADARSSVA